MGCSGATLRGSKSNTTASPAGRSRIAKTSPLPSIVLVQALRCTVVTR